LANALARLKEETGVVPTDFARLPHIAGYVVWIPDNMFVCFFISAKGTTRR
jgi:hypothetical protein